MAMEKNRYDANALRDYARNVLGKAGLASGYADDVARTLVEGDLMGHDTHGLALLPGYVRELQAGTMTCDGKPEVVSDRAATLLWDGHRLPPVRRSQSAPVLVIIAGSCSAMTSL